MASVAAAGAETPLILAIDVGSSSTRAILYDRRGRVVAGTAAQMQFELNTTVDGAAEVDPDLLFRCTAQCIDRVLAQAGSHIQQISAVAIDTFVTSTMAIDANGRPLTPLITFADTRNAMDANTLRRDLDETDVHERTGCLLRTSYWPARLSWVRRTQPEVWRAAARWITLGEYLELQLFGCCRVSFSVASWSGLLDRQRLVWDTPLLQYLGREPDHLSRLVDVSEPLHGLREPFARRWPALRAVPWFPAVGDGAAANIGSGCTSHDRVALTLGTTGALRVVQTDVAQVPRGLWCYRVDRQHALVGGATSEGGNVYAWLSETLRLGELAHVEAALAACTPDAHGLTVLPFLAGERSPDWAGNVQATLHGLTLATTPIAILRASLEAVAYRFALIEQRICGRPACSHRLIASGGALQRSSTWSQIFADVTLRPVVLSGEVEATSRGTAILALHALGVLSSLDALPATDGTAYMPDETRHTIYHAAIARQRRLYEQLIGPPQGA